MDPRRIVIIGAGPSGLGAAYRLNELGHRNWVLLEKNDYIGGLSASFVDDAGFTWDVGGHVLFSRYNYFDDLLQKLLDEAYYEHERESWIRIGGQWVPYPFQHNLRYLGEREIKECIRGLRQVRQAGNNDSANFKEWLLSTFGSGLNSLFMKPYNEKVWGYPLEKMDYKWIAERIAVVDLDRVERNIKEKKDDISWGPNNTFRFPRKGGTGGLFKRFLPFVDKGLRRNAAVTGVDYKNRKVFLADGGEERYDILINTMPLDLLINGLIPEDLSIAAQAEKLVHVSGFIVGLGFARKNESTKCWMYFPENNSPFYRVTNFYRYSPFNVPQGDTEKYFSLMCETTYSEFRRVNKKTIVDETIVGLINSGLIDPSDEDLIISRFLLDVPYTYPIPTLDRDEVLETVIPFLEKYDIYSRGRFGFWKYEVGNMDHSVMQGVEVVDRLLLGKPENTALL
jgi:protoporphyrinogen oxidase